MTVVVAVGMLAPIGVLLAGFGHFGVDEIATAQDVLADLAYAYGLKVLVIVWYALAGVRAVGMLGGECPCHPVRTASITVVGDAIGYALEYLLGTVDGHARMMDKRAGVLGMIDGGAARDLPGVDVHQEEHYDDYENEKLLHTLDCANI